MTTSSGDDGMGCNEGGDRDSLHTNVGGQTAKGGGKYRARTEDGEPDPIDVSVGSRLRLRRELKGLRQGDLAALLGLSFQQVQKYESGANRVGSSRLWYIAQALDVPIGYFFDDISRDDGLAEGPKAPYEPDRELLELIRNYRNIADPEVRRGIYDLVKRLAKQVGQAA